MLGDKFPCAHFEQFTVATQPNWCQRVKENLVSTTNLILHKDKMDKANVCTKHSTTAEYRLASVGTIQHRQNEVLAKYTVEHRTHMRTRLPTSVLCHHVHWLCMNSKLINATGSLIVFLRMRK